MNIQVIDGADNCTYDIFHISDHDFRLLFPSNGQDVEFIEIVESRIGSSEMATLMNRIFVHRVQKSRVDGIHGTIFFGLLHRLKYYPTKKTCEMVHAL